MKKLFLLCILSLPVCFAFAQDEVENKTSMNFGLGVGIDYGGFGGRFTLMPAKKFGIFIATGYNTAEAGFNGGMTYKFKPEKRVAPTFSAMYGYNGVIVVKGGDAESKTYYGPSCAIGIEMKQRRNRKNYWNFELVLPIRPKEFNDDIDALEDAGYSITKPLPIAFSVGFHFGN
jgi:hypothetical protein